ncbi:hypothetical protein Tco_1579372 [Tanacetum coccineum]
MGRQPMMYSEEDLLISATSMLAKAFRVFNFRRQEMEETYHVTFSEDDEAISQSSTEVLNEPDNIESSDNLEPTEVQVYIINEQISKAAPSPSIPSQITNPLAPQER